MPIHFNRLARDGVRLFFADIYSRSGPVFT